MKRNERRPMVMPQVCSLYHTWNWFISWGSLCIYQSLLYKSESWFRENRERAQRYDSADVAPGWVAAADHVRYGKHFFSLTAVTAECFRTSERGRAGIGVGFQGFFSRSICQFAAERKPIIEINGLKIIQAFLLKKEREEEVGGRIGSLRRDQTQQPMQQRRKGWSRRGKGW